uniref:PiggyBac transposable element-derived protein 4 C-terminal zinc-ribbon domain-containing protein n=1 Tax=Graphocephala atropunctata TaxID=36148 RepID=A0A1B6MJH2_9HEMI
MSSYYTPLRKSSKWYKKVAVEILLGTCVVNSLVIFNDAREPNRKWDMLRFREELIKKLVLSSNPVPTPDETPVRVPPNAALRVQGRQQLKHCLTKRDGLAHSSRKRCRSCYEGLVDEHGTKEARKKAKRVNTYCATCPDEPSMCLQCFNKVHK